MLFITLFGGKWPQFVRFALFSSNPSRLPLPLRSPLFYHYIRTTKKENRFIVVVFFRPNIHDHRRLHVIQHCKHTAHHIYWKFVACSFYSERSVSACNICWATCSRIQFDPIWLFGKWAIQWTSLIRIDHIIHMMRWVICSMFIACSFFLIVRFVSSVSHTVSVDADQTKIAIYQLTLSVSLFSLGD